VKGQAAANPCVIEPKVGIFCLAGEPRKQRHGHSSPIRGSPFANGFLLKKNRLIVRIFIAE
jgi:hypothetical protein